MEKKERIRLRIGTVLNDNRIDILSEDGGSLLHGLYRVIEQELDRAREEGYEKGVKDGLKGKVFKKVHLTEEYRPFKNRGELEEFLKNTVTNWDEIFKDTQEEWREVDKDI